MGPRRGGGGVGEGEGRGSFPGREWEGRRRLWEKEDESGPRESRDGWGAPVGMGKKGSLWGSGG